MNNSDTEITAALEAWLEETRSTIALRLGSLVQLIGLPRWHVMPSGSFKHYPFEPVYRFSVLDEEIFQNSATWHAVERLAENHGNLKRHFSEFVSSTNGMGRAFSLSELCQSMLPKLAMGGENSVYADTDFDVQARVCEFLEAINAKSVEHLTVWPIQGLATDTPVALDELTEFRELTVEEKLHSLNFEIIRPIMQQELGQEHARWFGLCRKINDTKTFGHDSPSDFDAFNNRMVELEQVLEDFLVSVPLTNDRVAFHAGGFSAAPHFENGKIFGFGAIGRGVGASNHIRFMHLDNDANLRA